jgi:hypothetical protein
MQADEATFILRDNSNVRYNVKTLQDIPIELRMFKVRKWLEENGIEPEADSVIDVYLDKTK